MKKIILILTLIIILIGLFVVGYLLYPLTYKGKDEIILFENEKFESLQDIINLKYFENKVVFIDVWGTYCGPCLNEFEYAGLLKVRFSNLPVEFLYLCTGNRIDHKVRWRQIIKDKNLKGYHVLSDDIYADIWKNLEIDEKEKYLIPHYFIVKNGEIVVHSAFNPSTEEKLYNQLDNILQRN